MERISFLLGWTGTQNVPPMEVNRESSILNFVIDTALPILPWKCREHLNIGLGLFCCGFWFFFYISSFKKGRKKQLTHEKNALIFECLVYGKQTPWSFLWSLCLGILEWLLHSAFHGLLSIAYYRLFQKETHYNSIKNTVNQYIANGVLSVGCHLMFLDWTNATDDLSKTDLLNFW